MKKKLFLLLILLLVIFGYLSYRWLPLDNSYQTLLSGQILCQTIDPEVLYLEDTYEMNSTAKVSIKGYLKKSKFEVIANILDIRFIDSENPGQVDFLNQSFDVIKNQWISYDKADLSNIWWDYVQSVVTKDNYPTCSSQEYPKYEPPKLFDDLEGMDFIKSLLHNDL